ncbi:spermidine synthase [Erwinia pyrifoliae]|uniref:spermidine synthase n=1 Tax=Erwinia pyrifoliae TaxID=79967 RepID=UPI0001C12E0D|nr:spermidine synthase [Erwinia pyrifoliae]AUX74265.1 spermidine synthase [Erwinia pyrifoliae]MCA8875381.1 spermidine synthase [Erwinia pyrifoliae]UWS29440.1 spermidine synthase [Erwinia pyrifoliae]UXK12430.1 spermidine synthase [Erwinia pyrifoliae]CAY72410.1 putative spermidine synthase [Erwinia pyrifoliae DSM 12163]
MLSKIIEPIGKGVSRVWDIEEIIFSKKTPFQEMVIAKTGQGVSLFCNNERQSVEESQLIYHEGQIIPAALFCGEIKHVLVVGSSEGVISKLALELGAKKVTHVDIDAECVDACARFLPYGYTTEEVQLAKEDNGPVHLIIGDGYKFIDDAIARGDKYDIIVLDLPDEQEDSVQQNRLYTSEFNEKITQLLTPEGVYISQAGCSTWWRNKTLSQSVKRFNDSFKSIVFFEMEEQNWVWLVGANFACDDIVGRMKQKLINLPYLPKFIDSQSIIKSTILPVSLRNSQ